ncbi:MAG: hypothetical protein ACLFQV_08825, partial [Vulcanimicrobiota bacterium]
MSKLVGFLHSNEGAYPSDVIEAINSSKKDVFAEKIKVNVVPVLGDNPYDVIIDRISHVLPFFRASPPPA